MPNLSQIKRQRMLDFLETLKKEHTDDESIRAFTEIENHIREKKYGLVWEEHVEHVDEMLEENIPVLSESEDKKLSGASGEKFNFIIEGDNLQSLYLLERTHKGKIDVIYIDPPYNTGSEDFKYDDNFVDELDSFRHSKWLSFMQRRLELAYSLLSESGLIMISIDDNEFATLKLLCDEIFYENNLLSVQHVQVRFDNKSLNEKNDWQPVMEYVLIYAKDKSNFKANKPSEEYSFDSFKWKIEELTEGTDIEVGGRRAKVFQKDEYRITEVDPSPEYYKETWASGSVITGNASGKFCDEYIIPRKDIDGLNCLYKVDGIGIDGDGLGYRYFTGPKKANSIRGKFYAGVPLVRQEGTTQKTKPITNYHNFDADFGNIRHEGGIPFNKGKKPVKMLKMLINYHKGKDITVLDFFAGSASTGHAVLELNKDDEGHRTFILCSNDENNICEEKTYLRMSNVINGWGRNHGIPANLKYFKCDWTPRKPEDYLLSNILCLHIKEMIELQNGIEIDNVKNVLILNKDDFRNIVMDKEARDRIENIWVNQNIIFNADELEILSSLGYKYIPKEFFGQELKEVAE